MTAQLSLPDRQAWTIDDLLALPDDGHRYEIIDGSLLRVRRARSDAAPGRRRPDRSTCWLAAAPDGVDVVLRQRSTSTVADRAACTRSRRRRSRSG